VNVAILQLGEAAGRAREMTTRAALGAGAGRLVRQLLAESVTIALAGAVVGTVLAWAMMRGLVVAAPARLPGLDTVAVNGRVLAFTVVCATLVGLIFGVAPAIVAGRTGTASLVRLGAGQTTRGARGLQRGLIAAQLALSMVLLVEAALLSRSLRALTVVDPGFRPAGLTVIGVSLPRDFDDDQVGTFVDAAIERIKRMPGVQRVSASSSVPFADGVSSSPIQVETAPGAALSVPRQAQQRSVLPGYLETLGIRLVAGRPFDAGDRNGSEPVAIVSQSVARQIWPDVNPVGQRISNKDDPGPGDWLTVIGVVDDVGQTSIDTHREPAIYQPIQQLTQTFFLGHMSFVVRAVGDPALLVPEMRRALRDVDPNQPIGSIGTMESAISATVAEPLFQARLIGAFSVVALVLAAIGIYGVVAYSVAERTHEIGIRVALGAGRADVVGMVLRRLLVLLVPGVAFGVIGALATTRVLSSLLFEIRPNDPATFVSVAGLLAAVAIVAGLAPARRASRVDPLVALRTG